MAAYRIFIGCCVSFRGRSRIQLVICTQKRDDLLGVDDARQSLIAINYRKRTQVVLVEEFSHLAARGIHVAGDEMSMGQISQRRGSGREQKLYERDQAQ